MIVENVIKNATYLILFYLIIKSSILSVTCFLFLIFLIYLLNLHKTYFYKKGPVVVDERRYRQFSMVQSALLFVATIIAFVGCYNYYVLKRVEYSHDWDWSKFILGFKGCKKLA
jgi:hypothetical protein